VTARVEVPRAIVAQAEEHYLSKGRPLLFAPRRKADWPLAALPGDSGKWLVLLDPESPPAMVVFAAAFMYRRDYGDILERLAKGAVAALAEVPQRFTCDGRTVGLWEVAEGSVCVRGPVALSLLSFVLREQGIGFFLTLSEGTTD